VVVSKKTDGRSAITISSRKFTKGKAVGNGLVWVGPEGRKATRNNPKRLQKEFLSLHVRDNWNMTNYISQRKRTLLAFLFQVH
jgi:hypothetical protein